MKRLADMHVPPALRRWALRLGLAVIVALALGNLPGGLLRRDARALKLEQQLAEQRADAAMLVDYNARLVREIDALRSDVHAIEDRARADLGMVYPDEIVLHVEPSR
jgi:cell division protein FtsB